MHIGAILKIVETVVSEVRAAKMIDKVLIISFDWQTLLNVKKLEPDLIRARLSHASYGRQKIATQ